jgi:hypothetical protein
MVSHFLLVPQGRHKWLQNEDGGNIADQVGKDGRHSTQGRYVLEMPAADRTNDLRGKYVVFESRDHDKEPHEHQQQRPVDLLVDLLAFDAAGEEQKPPAEIAARAGMTLAKNAATMASVTSADLIMSGLLARTGGRSSASRSQVQNSEG